MGRNLWHWRAVPLVSSAVRFLSSLGKRRMFPSSPWAVVLGILEEAGSFGTVTV